MINKLLSDERFLFNYSSDTSDHCTRQHILRRNSRCLVDISSISGIEERSSKYRGNIEFISRK
jgi:hypothetical protein